MFTKSRQSLRRAKPRRYFRPQVEPLEDRSLLAFGVVWSGLLSTNGFRLVADFNEPVNPGSVQATDLRIDGTAIATSASLVDPDTIQFNLPQLTAGTHVAEIATGEIQSLLGNGVELFRQNFEIASAPQYALKHYPRIQPGNAPLVGYAGSELDRIDVLWQTISGGVGTQDLFEVEYRASASNAWSATTSITSTDTGVEGRVVWSATITGLNWDTEYEYLLRHRRADVIVGQYAHTFRTRLAAGDATEFSFVAYGDSASGTALDFREVQGRINQLNPRFAVLLGDNVYPNGSHQEADSRFDPSVNPEAAEWIAGHVDYLGVGNHDIGTLGGLPTQQNFSVPIPVAGVNAPAAPPASEPPEHNFSWDYGDVHFVTFDTNSLANSSRLDGLLNWVLADLNASSARWKIVYGHHPLAGVPDKPEDPTKNYYQQVVNKLNSAGVDLFMVGHSHLFNWTFPLTGQTNGVATYADHGSHDHFLARDGLQQLVAGVGGVEVRAGDYGQFPFVAAGFSATTPIPARFGFAKIDVTPDLLNVSYVAADNGEIIDSFQIEKEERQTTTFQQGAYGYTGTVDTYLQQNAPSTSRSSSVSLRVDKDDPTGTGLSTQALIRFDNIFGSGPGQIPTDALLRTAQLQLEITDASSDNMNVHRMLTPWLATDTWNSRVGGIQLDGVEAAVTPDTSSGTSRLGLLSFNVLGSLQAWRSNPLSNQGWALIPTGSNGIHFSSAEGTIRPKLVVTWAQASPRTVVFEQGQNGYFGTMDTFVQQNSPSTNNGANTRLKVDADDPLSTGLDIQSLLRFDNLFGSGEGQIPTNSLIQSATLQLNVVNPGSAIDLHRMLRGWSANDTWTTLTDGIQLDGVEAQTVADARTAAVPMGPLSIDVLQSLQAWQSNPTSNLGWAIVPTGSDGVDIHSAEGTIRPRLTVVYVPATNVPPHAANDSATTNEDTSKVIDVLANDLDLDNGLLSVTAATNGALGTTSVMPDSTIRYYPTSNLSGTDSFTYTIQDGQGGTATATVTVTVSPVNDAPIAVNDAVNAYESTPITITVLSNDLDVEGNTLSTSIVSAPAYGTATVDASGAVSYTGAIGYSGPDSFTYRASDGIANSNDATVTISVMATTKFFVVDSTADKVFRYTNSGSSVSQSSLAAANTNARGVASNLDGSRLWIIDSNDFIHVYDATLTPQGSWLATDVGAPTGISISGDDLWLVDSSRDRVYRYTGGALRTSGTATSSSSFPLASSNGNAQDLVTDGTTVWVTQSGTTDRVFVYQASDGTSLGNWTLPSVNTAPVGITIDPTGASQSLWIVDSSTDRVYEYANARSRRSGTQTAAVTFNLNSSNSNPQGIADPRVLSARDRIFAQGNWGAHLATSRAGSSTSEFAPPPAATLFAARLISKPTSSSDGRVRITVSDNQSFVQRIVIRITDVYTGRAVSEHVLDLAESTGAPGGATFPYLLTNSTDRSGSPVPLDLVIPKSWVRSNFGSNYKSTVAITDNWGRTKSIRW